MMKQINDFLAGLPMTVAGGIFLAISLILSGAGIDLPVDPAWITVFICGVPLLYLAVRRIIHNKGISKISSALLISIAMISAIAIGDLFAAGRAFSAKPLRLLRLQPLMALAVAVQMVFSLFREKFDRPQKPFARSYGRQNWSSIPPPHER